MSVRGDDERISQAYSGIRLEQWLKDAIHECARNQHRSDSNWIRITLEKAVEKQLEKKK